MTKSFSKLPCMGHGERTQGKYYGIGSQTSMGEKGMEEIPYYLVFKVDKEWSNRIINLGSKEFLVFVCVFLMRNNIAL